MKYYLLENALADAIIGKNFDQVGYIKPSPILFNSWEFPKIKEPMTLELEDGAIPTDFLKSASMSATGFFIEEKIKQILINFKLVGHRFYKADLDEVANKQYYWLHIFDLSILDVIDYQKSIFDRTEYGFIEDKITIDSYKHYQALKKEHGVFFDVDLDKVVLPVNEKYDLYTFLPFDSSVFISQRLLMELERQEVTGFVATETDMIRFS